MENESKMKIGILAHGFMNWTGGIDFLRSVVLSLKAFQPEVQIIFLVPSKGPRVQLYNTIISVLNWITPLIHKGAAQRAIVSDVEVINMISKISKISEVIKIDIGTRALLNVCNKHEIDILLPSIKPLPKDLAVPWIGYLADFQHKYYPEYFSRIERQRRDKWFLKMLDQASSVLVNSNQTRSDASELAQDAKNKLVCLPFNAAPEKEWLSSVGSQKMNAHILKGPFFIICNQFWKHKGYEVALQAFSQFSKSHPNVRLIITGKTLDTRDPTYFGRIEELINNLGLTSRVDILGLVPKLDQIHLLRSSIALIQPTFFEGGPGGGSVYDAVSVGCSCIISDIAVNRELASESLVTYFKVGDANDLANVMRDQVDFHKNNFKQPAQLEETGHIRRQACGRVLFVTVENQLSKN